jgi:hypothetical protein
MICTLRHCSGHQIKEDGKSGHVARTGRREVHTDFWCGHTEGRDLDRQENNNKTDFKEMELEDVGCIYMAREKRKWRVLFNAVTNFGFY